MENQSFVNEVQQRVRQTLQEVQGVDVADKANVNSKERYVFYARMIYAYECYNRGVSKANIAKALLRSVKSVSFYLQKYNSEYRYHKRFRALADAVKERL